MTEAIPMRLLPWSGPEDRPAYTPFDDTRTRLHAAADEVETALLELAGTLRAETLRALEAGQLTPAELTYMLTRLVECLRDVLRIAEPRGDRLLPYREAES